MNLGQVYTKNIVADYMVGLFDLPKDAFMVDPCFGMGVFLESLKNANFCNITGIEIDPDSFDKLEKDKFERCNLVNQDFFSYNPQVPVDGFILNPPYVRQEEIDDMEMLGVTKESISDQCGNFILYSKANLYLYFIARCISLLKNGGQMVAIYPNAWLNTPDGKQFYSQILKKGSVDMLVQVNGYPFVGNPLVDVMIMKFTKGGSNKTQEQTVLVNENELVFKESNECFSVEGLNCVPLSTVARVRRGVTTGYNKVFINPDIKDEHYKVDILSSPKDIPGHMTSQARLDKLLNINATEKQSDEIEKYIRQSAAQILAQGKPKTLVESIKSNKNWYSLSLPQVPNLIFPYIIRDSVRFIINDAEVIVRDNFYSISSETPSKLLMALLNNLFVFSQLELCGKSYGNGLLKIQKYDVDNLVIPNPSKLNEISKQRLLKYVEELIKTSDPKYILEITNVLKPFYNVENIEEIYNSQKRNRLKYEL